MLFCTYCTKNLRMKSHPLLRRFRPHVTLLTNGTVIERIKSVGDLLVIDGRVWALCSDFPSWEVPLFRRRAPEVKICPFRRMSHLSVTCRVLTPPTKENKQFQFVFQIKLFRVSLRWWVLPIYCPRKKKKKRLDSGAQIYKRAWDMFSMWIDRSEVTHRQRSLVIYFECDVPAVWRCPRAQNHKLKPRSAKRSRGNYWCASTHELFHIIYLHHKHSGFLLQCCIFCTCYTCIFAVDSIF